jgi:hypothetical protein
MMSQMTILDGLDPQKSGQAKPVLFCINMDLILFFKSLQDQAQT